MWGLQGTSEGVCLFAKPDLRFGVGILAGILISLHFLTAIARGGETHALTNQPLPVTRQGKAHPQELAARHERAGRKLEAAKLYEEMAHTDPSARKALSHRLVTIYTETGETDMALKWAREVMRENPDPQAYLAGVYAHLGQFKQAREILEKEIASNTNATRAVTLRWQLAKLHEKAGKPDKARRVLKEAADKAKETPMEAAAQRRLKAFEVGKK